MSIKYKVKNLKEEDKDSWENQREKLKVEYQFKKITSCEARIPGCMDKFALSFHHRHRRWWYTRRVKLLGDFNQTMLVCAYCHDALTGDEPLSQKLFLKLRGKEIL